jgi:primosomal protein N' (replication factor Y)
VGIVTAVDVEPPPVTPREVLLAPDPIPALTPPLLRTAEWMAGYYGSPLGLAIRAALPAALWGESSVELKIQNGGPVTGGTAGALLEWLDRRGGSGSLKAAAKALKKPLWNVVDRLQRIDALEVVIEPARTDRHRATGRVLRLAGPRLTLLEREERFKRRPKQRMLYDTLEQFEDGLGFEEIEQRVGVSASVVRQLVDAGLAEVGLVERHRDPFADDAGSPPPGPLSPAQRRALESIEHATTPDGVLLFGVTGSGKTLVYLEAIRRILAEGKGAIILVPEIGLTPQTVSRVRGVFGNDVAVLHSALSDGERRDAWLALRRGERRVAVGPRSAVFAPIERLGYLVIDEEHETSYKNGEAPRYHARDVARVRCRLEGARLVLGSATPALETASEPPERLRVVELPERVGERPLPPVTVVDLRTAPRVTGVFGVPWSQVLDTALHETLARGEQALLLLNRRGFAAFVQCHGCGTVRMCPRCSISLTVHRTPALLKCHYCGYQEEPEPKCEQCGEPMTQSRGVGTQQIEQVASLRAPAARLARMDLDTTGTKWSHHRILDRVGRGEVDILVGTQMIAKGIDFPNVTLVGVIDADTALHLPDFRASERTFQLLTQVAGRAGRGPKGGRVLVQTWSPNHPAVQFAVNHDTRGFWAAELANRIQPAYPPSVALVNLIASGTDEAAVARETARAAEWLVKVVERTKLEVMVLGPAPCPVARVKDRWRWHVLLKGPKNALGSVVRYAAPRLRPRGEVRFALDRDPVSVL